MILSLIPTTSDGGSIYLKSLPRLHTARRRAYGYPYSLSNSVSILLTSVVELWQIDPIEHPNR